MTYRIPRRNFLGLAAATAGGAMLGLPRLALQAPPTTADSRWASRPTRYVAFRWTKRSSRRELGVTTLEFFPGHLSPKASAAEIEAVQKKVQALGLKTLSHGVNAFTADHQANRAIFEFAKRAGIRNLSADPHEDAFDSLDRLVAEYDIRIAIHNHGPDARYDKVADVLGAIKGHHPSIGAARPGALYPLRRGSGAGH